MRPLTYNFNLSVRQPLDPEVRHGDLIGLLDTCVIISLANGSIIQQNIYPGYPHCQPKFLQHWSQLLSRLWAMVINSVIDNVRRHALGDFHWMLCPRSLQWFTNIENKKAETQECWMAFLPSVLDHSRNYSHVWGCNCCSLFLYCLMSWKL